METVKGMAAARRKMRQRAERIQGKSGKLYPQLSEMLSKSISATFRAKGRPSWKKRKDDPYWPPWPILYKTGMMRARAESTALRGPWLVSGGKHLLNVSSKSYGIYHQYGTKSRGKKKGLPERKFVKPSEKERVAMRDRIRREWNI